MHHWALMYCPLCISDCLIFHIIYGLLYCKWTVTLARLYKRQALHAYFLLQCRLRRFHIRIHSLASLSTAKGLNKPRIIEEQLRLMQDLVQLFMGYDIDSATSFWIPLVKDWMARL